jgi:4-hydroxybenzoate polyprenyltransferase
VPDPGAVPDAPDAAEEPPGGSFALALRLVHPFPSILDGLVVAIVALIAGAGLTRALGLGISMILLQFAIGTLNDLVDASSDAGRKPGKPIPAGVVSVRQARLVALACAALGLALALLQSPALAGLALVGLLIGVWYDHSAKGTTLSWLPFALGIPLLPVYGWLGATGGLPTVFLVLVPAAANAGAAIAIANALVDVERDTSVGDTSVAVALGARRAGLLVVLLHLVVAVLALGTAIALGAPDGWVVAIAGACLVPLGGAALGAVASVRPSTSWREAAFEIQAVGTGLVAVAWLGALSAAAGMGS